MMRFTYYGYNAFIIEGEELTLIIDPGQNLHWRKLDSLIPQSRWSQADLILVTHGDADHAEFVPRVAQASGAPIVCGPALAEPWRRKGLDVVPLRPGQTNEAAGMRFEGITVQHGGPTLTLFGRSFTFKPKFVGKGGVGLLFDLDERRLLNLGDTLLMEQAWEGVRVDLLMVPIGGMTTMDVDDALQAVAVIQPGIVIPMHYNWDLLFYHRPADVERFAAQVEAAGRQCFPLQPGEEVEL
jgi:L-ascorbate metabolism protein UlaG (beta-lactamase superfamily)